MSFFIGGSTMFSALSREARKIIDKLLDGRNVDTRDDPLYFNEPYLQKIIDLDKTISYNPHKKYDMFDGEFKFDSVVMDDNALAFLYYDQPYMDQETRSSLFGNTNTAIHFTTIKSQIATPVRYMRTRNGVRTFNTNCYERELLIVSTLYAESLYNSLEIRELIDYIKQLLLASVLKKMPAYALGILPNRRTYKSIGEYVELCIIHHLFDRWISSSEQLQLLYDKIEPLRLYENYADFNKQNRWLYKMCKD